MTRFLDLRVASVGGPVGTAVAIHQGDSIATYQSLPLAQFLADIRGRHVLLATHGFNVNRADGIAHLSNWERLLQTGAISMFVGVLWPGDSVWAHGLDYPAEPRVANEAGELLAPFIDANFGGAASVSFASHSLGARLVLQTISRMTTPVRRLTLMAGAIDDDCLIKEFQGVTGKVGGISVLASSRDKVLSELFPLGNLLGGILTAGHPWLHGALGHVGPSRPWPANLRAPFQIPDNWNYDHGDYLRVDNPPAPALALPVDVPPNGTAEPSAQPGWQENWSAAFTSTRFE